MEEQTKGKQIEAFSRWLINSDYRWNKDHKLWYRHRPVDTDDFKPGKTVKEIYEEFINETKRR